MSSGSAPCNNHTYAPSLRKQVLGWLAEASTMRRVQPPFTAAAVQKLLAETANDPDLQAEAIGLATAWKVKEATPELLRIAQDKAAKQEVRFAAIDSLAALSGAAGARRCKS